MFCFILLLSAVVIGLMCLSSRRIQSVLTRSICSSRKTVLPFLFSVQHWCVSNSSSSSCFCLVELFIFHMLQKIRWIFFFKRNKYFI